jgi:hypothetical protein
MPLELRKNPDMAPVPGCVPLHPYPRLLLGRIARRRLPDDFLKAAGVVECRHSPWHPLKQSAPKDDKALRLLVDDQLLMPKTLRHRIIFSSLDGHP